LLKSDLAVQQHHCQMKEFVIVLVMSLVMATVYFMPFHISLLGQFLSNTNYVKAIVSNMPNFEEELFNSITIYSYSLTPTFVGWARYGTRSCMAFLVILLHVLCI
uniref:Uncharacterized protein n=1 Tax=Amphimedon queenslandica TaxID=400682 RepID=A0A1X7TT35_AMPQE